MGSPPQNPNWVFDYGVIDDILPSLDPPGFSWPDHSFAGPTAPGVEFDDSFGNPDSMKETGLRKRVRTGSCNVSGSKACREKMRRDRLNDRLVELSSILEPERPPKTDKVAILGDAIRMVTQLRGEAQQLEESRANLQETVNELKAEKNELRDEKQRLKAEKENIERQMKALGTQPSFLPHPAAIPTPFSAPGQVVGGKMMPFFGYPGMSMWQFMPPAAVDTSQDHVLRPPVA
ncbi:transcription factor ILR3-like [Pyrus ussuriensis x Pyrus communis]|uniref:Transcription factor ILR3-like n=1 Tax=Pyrus ussuriensis x Pyrus communis TaxID=2448454 RepID=A0A5N5FD88_9ROSA|nr:transcription factor ILR3-like [Pyrus ussuriensis x Pyrus communis]